MIHKLLRLVGFKTHNWKYRNPYDRTCKLCGLNQNQFHYPGFEHDFWKPMNAISNHPCNEAKED